MQYKSRMIAIVIALLLTASACFGQGVLYSEIFSSDGSIDYSATDEGWSGIFAGSKKNKLSIKTGNLGGGTAVNSDVQSIEKGKAYMEDNVGSNFLMYTREHKIDITEIKSMQFNSKISNTVDVMRLAVNVGGNYYISGKSFNQIDKTTKQTNILEFGGSKWKIATAVSGGGIEWSELSPDVYLPSSGNIRQFGVYFQDVSGKVRVDNFSVMSVPEPALLALLALGMLIVYIYRMRHYAKEI